MAQRDDGNPPKRPLRVKEVLRRNLDKTTQLVCYAVVSGRGKTLTEHLGRVDDKTVAHRIANSINAIDAIAALIDEYDASVWDGVKAKAAARTNLLRDIRRIVGKARVVS